MKRKYPEYKDCGIEWLDEVPKHWSVNQLRRVAEVNNSNVNKKSYEDETPVRLCNYTDVYYNEYITDEMELMQSTASESEIDQYTLEEGDVIITKDSEDWDDIGVPACVAEPLTNVLCGYHLTILKGHEGEMDGRFLLRALQSSGIKEQLHVAARGITRYGLSLRDMKRLLLPIPPLEEQRSIAAYLDRKTAQIDTLIAKKQRLIDLLQKQRTAVINRAVTQGLDPDAPMQDSGIEWLGEVPAHWDVTKLKFKAKSVSTGSTPSTKQPEFYEGGQVDWYGPGDFGERVYLSSSERRITELALEKGKAPLYEPGTVLIVGIGATLGKVGIVEDRCSSNQQINAVAFKDDYNPYYGVHYLNSISSVLTSWSNSATLPILNQTQTKQLPVLVPPKEEQDEIVQYISRVDEEVQKVIQREKAVIELLQELRTSLISEVVTGKIDVRDEVPERAEVAA
jgi:type I restriction enzyme S subunit